MAKLLPPIHRSAIAWPVLMLVVIAIASGCNTLSHEQAAEAAALVWLESVDRGEYRASWAQGASFFQESLTADKWERSLQSVRDPLGTVRSRKLKNALYTTSLPGAPKGEYVVLQFETTFSDGRGVIETVTPMLDDGEWKVSGYYVR